MTSGLAIVFNRQVSVRFSPIIPTYAVLMQTRQNQDAEIQRQIHTQQAEIDSQRREIEQFKAQQER